LSESGAEQLTEGKSDEKMGEFLFDIGHSVGFSLRMFEGHKKCKD